ncbi:MAG: radical SAM protein [bacterium]|nr:radical SAM protein [bacterium]
MKKICLVRDGCPQRGLDCARLKNYFQLNDCLVVDEPGEADHIIAFSCGIHRPFLEKNLKRMKELNQYDAELIVAGCLPAMASEKLGEVFQGRTLGTKDLSDVDTLFPGFKLKFHEVPDENFVLSRGDKPQFAKDISAVYLRVSSGCSMTCAYCLVPVAVGSFESKPLDVCAREYENIIKQGHRHITLVAEDTGAYGVDTNSSFALLMEKLSEIDKDASVTWHVHHFNPHWAIKYKAQLIENLKEGKIVSMQVPIGSGSPKILKHMGRYNDTEAMKTVFHDLKKASSDVYISTHYIIGFPTETEEDFHTTVDFIKEAGFDEVTLVACTEHEITPCFKMEGKVDEDTKTQRMELANRLLANENMKVIMRKVQTEG